MWSNGVTTSTITIFDAGTYSVEITSANGCKSSNSIIIVEFNTVTAQIESIPVTCKGGTTGKIIATGLDGIKPYQYKLNNGVFQSDNTFNNLVSGTYTVSIKDAGGCTASVNVTVNEPSSAINLTLTPTNLKCNGVNDGKIVATATGGTPNYSFAIDGGSPQSGNVFSSLSAGTYTIATLDSKGCIATATTTLTQPSKITVTVTATTTIDCNNPKGTITVTAAGGTTPYSYSIDGTTFKTTGSFANLDGGNYTITVQDINACFGTATAVITVADTTKPTFKATATTPTCTAGTANKDGKITLSNIINGVNYQYSTGGTFNTLTATAIKAINIPIDNLINPTENSQVYTIRVYNSNGCFKDVSVELLKRVCACKTDICVPYKITKTKSK